MWSLVSRRWRCTWAHYTIRSIALRHFYSCNWGEPQQFGGLPVFVFGHVPAFCNHGHTMPNTHADNITDFETAHNIPQQNEDGRPVIQTSNIHHFGGSASCSANPPNPSTMHADPPGFPSPMSPPMILNPESACIPFHNPRSKSAESNLGNICRGCVSRQQVGGLERSRICRQNNLGSRQQAVLRIHSDGYHLWQPVWPNGYCGFESRLGCLDCTAAANGCVSASATADKRACHGDGSRTSLDDQIKVLPYDRFLLFSECG